MGLITETNQQYYQGAQGFLSTGDNAQVYTTTFDTDLIFGDWNPANANYALNINCLFKPSLPQWGFTPGSLGQYLYNANSSVDFELDNSEQTSLITNILKYSGVIINDPTIIQAAEQEAQQASINEKS